MNEVKARIICPSCKEVVWLQIVPRKPCPKCGAEVEGGMCDICGKFTNYRSCAATYAYICEECWNRIWRHFD